MAALDLLIVEIDLPIRIDSLIVGAFSTSFAAEEEGPPVGCAAEDDAVIPCGGVRTRACAVGEGPVSRGGGRERC